MVTAFPRFEGDVITPWLGQVLLGMKRRGLEAEVLAPSYRGGGATTWKGVPVYRFRYAPAVAETLTHDETVPDRLKSRPLYAALLPGYLLGGVLRAMRLGVTDPPDVVHVHWPVPHALFGVAMCAASGGRTAVVTSCYSVEIKWTENKLPWLVPFLRWSLENSDEVTAISESTADAVRRHVQRTIPIIPHGSAVANRSRVRRRAPATQRVGGPGEVLRILFVGRLVERKGVEILIRALAKVRERIQATLTVIGSGPLRAELEAAARSAGVREHVEFRGFVSSDELALSYGEHDVFVLPAIVDSKGDTEGLGVVLIEALQAGLPVVASRAGGIVDIVRDGETGWLVTPGDLEALTSALLQVADDPARARERARRGRRDVAKRFGIDSIVDNLLECYDRAVARREGIAHVI